MSDNINIQEILKKHTDEIKFFTRIGNTTEYDDCTYQLQNAFKEALEAVVDKCKEEAVVDYWMDVNTCIHYVDKQSILNVKNMIDYGKEN